MIRDDKPIATLGAGEMFGETALVCNHSRGATVRSVTALDLVVINREAFQELLGNLPGLKREIEAVMVKRMGRPVDLCQEVTVAISDRARM